LGASETSLGSSSAGLTVDSAKTRLSSGLVRAALGTLVGVSVFVAGLVLDPLLSVLFPNQWVEGQIDPSFAYAALALVVIGLSILFTSATAILTTGLRSETNENRASVFSTLRMIFSKGIYSRVLLLSAVVYAFFYALASGIIVYNPSVNFSTVYHASVPSSFVATCCAPLGQTPLAVVYPTEHVGLLLVPANLLLLFSVSWLVGLNVALAAFAFSLRSKKRGIGLFGGVGATLGLFTSCPTCAGLAVLSFFASIGGVGGLSTLLFLEPIRVALVATSYPTLIGSSFLTAKTLNRMINSGCVPKLN
jgi:hypothetical protein